MNKRDQIPQLFYVVRGYNANWEIIKSVECRGNTKEEAAKAMGQALQMMPHCKGVAHVKEFWAHEIRQENWKPVGCVDAISSDDGRPSTQPLSFDTWRQLGEVVEKIIGEMKK